MMIALGALLSNQVLVEQEENVVGRFILVLPLNVICYSTTQLSRLLILGAPETFLARSFRFGT